MQGALSQLDTRNPVLYIDFLEGRLKFLGTLMFPANKYMVLKFGNREILCEDVLDSMVGFNQDRIAAVLVLKVTLISQGSQHLLEPTVLGSANFA